MKTIYVIPDIHPYRKEFAGGIANKMIKTSLERRAKSNCEPFRINFDGYSFEIEDTDFFTWENFPKIVSLLSDQIGVGDYEKKASLIDASRPDVLFLESFRSNEKLYRQLPFVETDYLLGALGEDNRFASRKPILEVCKKSNISIIPVEDDALVKEADEVNRKLNTFHGIRDDEHKALEEEQKRIINLRSQSMLKEMNEKITDLGEDKTYLALFGEIHYENMLKNKTDVNLLHINDRLKALGLDIKYES